MVAVGIRNIASFEMEIPQSYYDEMVLLDLIEIHALEILAAKYLGIQIILRLEYGQIETLFFFFFFFFLNSEAFGA